VPQNTQDSAAIRRLEDAARALAEVVSAFERDEPPMVDGRPDLQRLVDLATQLDDAWADYDERGRFFDL
jgi:hypothetical protein